MGLRGREVPDAGMVLVAVAVEVVAAAAAVVAANNNDSDIN